MPTQRANYICGKYNKGYMPAMRYVKELFDFWFLKNE